MLPRWVVRVVSCCKCTAVPWQEAVAMAKQELAASAARCADVQRRFDALCAAHQVRVYCNALAAANHGYIGA